MHALLGEAFAAGLVVDGLEEPAFPRVDSDSVRSFTWDSVWQIPPVLAMRLRKQACSERSQTPS
jgi:hypothetical protein